MTSGDRHPRRHAELGGYNPDPLYVEPGPVRRSMPHPAGPSRRWELVLGLVAFLVVLVLAALATPRPEPAISPSPTQAGAPFGGNGPAGAPIAAAAVVGGLATYYDAPSSSDAAAGPGLRAFLGSGWRGSWVTVHADGRSVRVQLTDWCACGDRHGQPTLIDLDDRAFARLAPLSRGVVAVAIEASSSSPTLPPTDAEGLR